MIGEAQGGAQTESLHGSYAFAYASLLLFVLIYFARPEDWIPGLGAVRPAFIAGGLAIIGFILAALGSGLNIFSLPREIWYMVALFVQLFAAAVFSPVWRGGAFQVVVYTFSKIVLIAIIITLVVTTLDRLRRLVFIQASSFALVAIISFLESQKLGGRLMGSLNGIYGNPNDLAFAIALGFPLCWIFLHRTSSLIKKLAWVLCMGAMSYAVFLTASRSGLIVLAISVLVCLWEFGIKGGRRYLLVIGAFVAVAVVAFAPMKLMERRLAGFETASASEAAYSSFQQRRDLLSTSLRVSEEHPLFGVGPGNFPVVSGNWHVAHNSLTELSAEGGFAALILFLLMVKTSFSNLRESENHERGPDELQLWRSGLKVAMITLVVGSLFSSIEYQFFPYMLMAYTNVLHRIATEVDADARQSQTLMAQPAIGQDYGFTTAGNSGQVPNMGIG